MRISPTRICRSWYRPRGFTFIEMMIVMLLLGVVIFVAVPAFQNMLEGRLTRETNRLSGVIRLLRNEAVLQGLTFRIMMDLKEATYWVEQRGPDGEFLVREDAPLMRKHTLPATLVVERMLIFGDEILPLRDEPVPIVVDASGFVDPFVMHILDDDSPYTFKVSGFAGKVSLVEGHEVE